MKSTMMKSMETEMECDETDVSQHPLYRSLINFWHPVAYAHELKEQPLGVKLMGKKLAIARTSQGVIALDDRCAHRGAALSIGNVIDDCIECPYHGWRYRSDGQCTLVPAREELTDVLKGKVQSYQVAEQSGLIWVCLSQAKFPIPSYPEFDDPGYRISFPNVYDWRTSTPRRLENFIDFSHFPFVHHGSIGTRSNPRVETFESWREDAVLRFRRSGVKEPNLPWHRELMGVEEGEIEPINEYYVTMPHTVRLVRKFPNDCTYVIFMATSPMDGRTSRSFTIQARNYGKDAQNDKLFTDMNDTVIEEDRPVIESQRPVMIPLMPEEAHMELPVRGADAITTEYRRWLLQLMKELHPS